MIRLTYVHTLYSNTNKNTMACCKRAQSYMSTYPLQQHKHQHKGMLLKLKFLHIYIPSTTTPTKSQRLVARIPSLTWVHNLYKNSNINTKDGCQNSQSYMCTYTLQQHKHKKNSCSLFTSLTCVHTL